MGIGRRMTVARALARAMLEKRGETPTPEDIEREAAVIARGLFVERAGDDVTLIERAFIDSKLRFADEELRR